MSESTILDLEELEKRWQPEARRLARRFWLHVGAPSLLSCGAVLAVGFLCGATGLAMGAVSLASYGASQVTLRMARRRLDRIEARTGIASRSRP